MSENSFRIYKGDWLLKEYILNTAAGAVEKGDLIEIATADDQTTELATDDAACIVGIAAANYANDASNDTNIKVWVPNSPKAEMIGRITDGVAVVGTDINRNCDVEDHEGVDVDTKTHSHLFLVKVTVATADGSSTAGEGVFRIVQTPEMMGAF